MLTEIICPNCQHHHLRHQGQQRYAVCLGNHEDTNANSIFKGSNWVVKSTLKACLCPLFSTEVRDIVIRYAERQGRFKH